MGASVQTGPILGSWYLKPAPGSGGTDEIVFTFLNDGTFLIADKGTHANDPTGQSGLEWGTYTWNETSGDFSYNVAINTDGEWGVSNSGITNLKIANGILTGSGSDAAFVASRVTSPPDSIVGSWYAAVSGGGTDQIVFTFLADGTLMIADKGTHANDPTGDSGIEWGTYTWNSSTGLLTTNILVNTDGQWGTSHPQPGESPHFLVTGDTITVNGGLQVQRESTLVPSIAPAQRLVGDDSANTLTGTAFNDVFTGLGGNDTIDGGAGIDTVLYGSAKSAYSIGAGGSSVTSTHGAEGIDTIAHVERFVFADKHIAFDVMNGNAGIAAKILGSVFGPSFVNVPEYVGIGLHYLDAGMSYETLIGASIQVALGAQATNNGAVVDLLFNNVVGFAPNAELHDLFVGMLDSHQFTIEQFAVAAADSDFMAARIDLTGRAATGIEYA